MGGADMIRSACLGWVIALLAFAPGCADQKRDDLEHQSRKMQSERDATRQQLDEERAANAALKDRLGAQTRERDLTRAEADALRAQVDRLTQFNRELTQLVEQQDSHEMQRPQIVAVRLPAVLDQALSAFAEKRGDAVSYDRARGAVKFKSDLLFESGSDVLRAESRGGLSEFAKIAASPEAADFEVIIAGHSDDTPITRGDTLTKHPTNWHLSVHRAIAVKNAIVQAGLAESSVAVMGYGQFRPLGTDKAQNRRVEIFLAQKGEVRPLGNAAPKAADRPKTPG